MTVLSFDQSNKKYTLGWQNENGSKDIINIKSHSPQMIFTWEDTWAAMRISTF